jgi:hypothetical protein
LQLIAIKYLIVEIGFKNIYINIILCIIMILVSFMMNAIDSIFINIFIILFAFIILLFIVVNNKNIINKLYDYSRRNNTCKETKILT